VLTANSEMRTRRALKKWSCAAGRVERLLTRLSWVTGDIAARARELEGAELLEFGLALPMILVMVVGLLDFSHAYSVKQKLASAAREGARYQAIETADRDSSNPTTVPSLRDDVVTYLTNAGGINTSFIGTTLSYNGPTCTGTYYTTRNTVNYGLKVERCVQVVDTTTGTTIESTRVTLFYPYDWTFGFDRIIKLIAPSSTFTSPITIQTDATMSNF
jgi:Flp pilus assembly protein TadG